MHKATTAQMKTVIFCLKFPLFVYSLVEEIDGTSLVEEIDGSLSNKNSRSQVWLTFLLPLWSTVQMLHRWSVNVDWNNSLHDRLVVYQSSHRGFCKYD